MFVYARRQQIEWDIPTPASPACKLKCRHFDCFVPPAERSCRTNCEIGFLLSNEEECEARIRRTRDFSTINTESGDFWSYKWMQIRNTQLVTRFASTPANCIFNQIKVCEQLILWLNASHVSWRQLRHTHTHISHTHPQSPLVFFFLRRCRRLRCRWRRRPRPSIQKSL